MAINFDLNDLQAFRAVAQLSSFRRAAESIHISQPALSRRIDKLEEALGVKLFERSTRRVALTNVGRAFARDAERILDDLDNALLGIRDVASSSLGHVTIACVPSAAYYFMPQVISRYHRAFPRIRISVLDASANGRWPLTARQMLVPIATVHAIEASLAAGGAPVAIASLLG